MGDAVAHGFPTGAVPVEIAVFELDAGPMRVLLDEPDLDLTGGTETAIDVGARYLN